MYRFDLDLGLSVGTRPGRDLDFSSTCLQIASSVFASDLACLVCTIIATYYLYVYYIQLKEWIHVFFIFFYYFS